MFVVSCLDSGSEKIGLDIFYPTVILASRGDASYMPGPGYCMCL